MGKSDGYDKNAPWYVRPFFNFHAPLALEPRTFVRESRMPRKAQRLRPPKSPPFARFDKPPPPPNPLQKTAPSARARAWYA
jgi:hypothetical protein